MARKELVAIAVVLVVVLALAAGAQSPVSYANDVEPVFVKACSECHGGDNPKKGLDLSKGNGYAHLVDIKSQEVPAMILVKAGEPAASYLWLKLTHTATEGRGMPRTLFSSKKLPKADLDLVQNWIVQGAKP
jgi:hypothetical protein